MTLRCKTRLEFSFSHVWNAASIIKSRPVVFIVGWQQVPLHLACSLSVQQRRDPLPRNLTRYLATVHPTVRQVPLHFACIKGAVDVVGMLAIFNANMMASLHLGLDQSWHICFVWAKHIDLAPLNVVGMLLAIFSANMMASESQLGLIRAPYALHGLNIADLASLAVHRLPCAPLSRSLAAYHAHPSTHSTM